MFSAREMDVLNILWKSKTPMTSTDVVNEKRDLTQSTAIAVLRKLLRDGLVDVDGVVHSGKVLSRTYRPTEQSRQALMDNFMELYGLFYAVVPAEELAARILEIGKK